MLKIRMKRFGKKNQPVFRIVVMPARTNRQSNTIEEIGFIDPIKKIRTINAERAKYWLSVGAQPTYSIERLLIREKVIKSKDQKKFEHKPGKKASDRSKAKEAAAEQKAEAPKEEKAEA